MAAVEVTITGTLYDKLNRTTQQVVLIGEASLTGVGVGGGPIIPAPKPPDPGAHPEHPIYYPPGIWGPTDPRPTPPIAGIPGLPGYEPPTKPPDPVQPPIDWKAVWHPTEGWIVVGVPQFPHPTPSST